MFEFDFSKPVVAASEFAAGERVVRAGEVFDWRAHGMTDVEIVPLVRAGIVRQPPALERAVALGKLVKLSEEYGGAVDTYVEAEGGATDATASFGETLSKVVTLAVSPGETVRVETPSQRDARRNKRR